MLYEKAMKYYNKQYIYKCIELLKQDIHNKNAYYRLATIYIDAHGVKKDLQKAKEYLLKAIELNSTKATFLLASLYENKQLEYNDITDFLSLYQQAANNNHSKSIFKLANFYLKVYM